MGKKERGIMLAEGDKKERQKERSTTVTRNESDDYEEKDDDHAIERIEMSALVSRWQGVRGKWWKRVLWRNTLL